MKFVFASAAVILTNCAVLSAAFGVVPAATSRAPTNLQSYETAPGATAPVGYWDPLALTRDKDQELFDKARWGEIRNGRAAMLAVIGYIVPEIFRFPGELATGLKFADIPNGVAAINVIPAQFWIATCFAIGSFDYTMSSHPTGYHAPLAIEMDEETAKTRESNEVNNGRLAMLAFWELVRHDVTREAGEPLIQGLPFLYN